METHLFYLWFIIKFYFIIQYVAIIYEIVIPDRQLFPLLNILFILEWLLFFIIYLKVKIVIVVQLLSHVQLFVTPWTVALQDPLSSSISQSWLKFMSKVKISE